MRYGSIEGTIVNLSADAVVPQDANNAAGAAGAATTGPQAAPQMLSYTARIEIEREHLNVNGRDVRLVPVMSVTADLLTGERDECWNTCCSPCCAMQVKECVSDDG